VFLKALPFGVPPNGPKSDDQSAMTFNVIHIASKHGESLFLPRIISEYPVDAEGSISVGGDIPSLRIRSEYPINPEGGIFVDGGDPVRAGIPRTSVRESIIDTPAPVCFHPRKSADTQIRSGAHFNADFPKSEFAALFNSACANIVRVRKTTGAPLKEFKSMVGYSLVWNILKPPYYSLIWQAMILWSIDDGIGWTYCFRCWEHVAYSIQDAPFGSNPGYERFGYFAGLSSTVGHSLTEYKVVTADTNQFFHRSRIRRVHSPATRTIRAENSLATETASGVFIRQIGDNKELVQSRSGGEKMSRPTSDAFDPDQLVGRTFNPPCKNGEPLGITGVEYPISCATYENSYDELRNSVQKKTTTCRLQYARLNQQSHRTSVPRHKSNAQVSKTPTPTFGDNDFMANYSKVWQTLKPVLFLGR
jgi:hypothetical protein